jgi:hypothetical protein
VSEAALPELGEQGSDEPLQPKDLGFESVDAIVGAWTGRAGILGHVSLL